MNSFSDSTLTCNPFKNTTAKYNLADVGTYPRILDLNGKILYNPFQYPCNSFEDAETYAFCANDNLLDEIVRIPLPRRSLLVFYGQPRYQWEHCILREDITSRRVIIAYREFTPPYLPGGRDELLGKEILRIASEFWE